ncbi:hypothetical protein [Noviherbaspirillum aridicola]|uniref:Uncharacterized protein n=1 Tax=Noviherbaspirillum aridicola TaxID=2849687 RepID=A0ABQ4PYV6_9BURK|nr:hypothetical protein [Noviherbaspirillum aridicola]GIZ50086.1 hypothetical protein NCCP691_01000 [Noviherbaspirillum aridicola]
MSNLQSAKDALRAELEHAREGLAYYQSRVEALQQTLSSLNSLEGKGGQDAAPARGRRRKEAAANGAARPAKAGRAKKSQSDLPATGKEFWAGLVTSEPQSSREILNAAVKALGITPAGDDLKKLAQRQANALHMLVKAGAISDSGTGRDRRYLKQ